MQSLIQFILPACGMYLVVSGGRTLYRATRRANQGAQSTEAGSESSEAPDSGSAAVGRGRLFSGVLWIGIGIATILITGFRFGLSPEMGTTPNEPPEASLAALVADHVERDFNQNSRVGLVVGAVSGAEELVLGFGKRSLGHPDVPDADTVFEIGSISKVFTGILLAQSIENEELDLDDRLADSLPTDWTVSVAVQGVTLRHLTTHTSGFPRLPANMFNLAEYVRAVVGGDPYRRYSEDEFRDAIATVDVEYVPGTDDLYSNFGVGVLGHVLSTRNGTDYETLVKDAICGPLEMNRTVITSDQWHRDHLATGYRAVFKLGPVMLALESSPWELPNHLAGAGGIRSTGNDMLKFLKANLGLIETPFDTAIRRSHQELYKRRAGSAIGMNWQRTYHKSIAQNVLWHNGGTGGYKTFLGFTEDLEHGVFVLSNTTTSVDRLAMELLLELARQNKEVTVD